VNKCKPLRSGHERRAAADLHPRGRAAHLAAPGRAVQVDPIKPMLKAPGTKRLKLNGNELHSNFAFKFNMRRYSLDSAGSSAVHGVAR